MKNELAALIAERRIFVMKKFFIGKLMNGKLRHRSHEVSFMSFVFYSTN